MSRQSDMGRFMDKVHHEPNTGCWLWGANFCNGRGQFVLGGKNWIASRASWALHYSDPESMFVLHKCDNPPCVNPDHLFLGTHQDNMLDMDRKGRRDPVRGSAHGSAKMTEESVVEMRRRYTCGETQDSLADAFGIRRTTVSCIVRRETWTHVK